MAARAMLALFFTYPSSARNACMNTVVSSCPCASRNNSARFWDGVSFILNNWRESRCVCEREREIDLPGEEDRGRKWSGLRGLIPAFPPFV